MKLNDYQVTILSGDNMDDFTSVRASCTLHAALEYLRSKLKYLRLGNPFTTQDSILVDRRGDLGRMGYTSYQVSHLQAIIAAEDRAAADRLVISSAERPQPIDYNKEPTVCDNEQCSSYAPNDSNHCVKFGNYGVQRCHARITAKKEFT